VQGLTGPYGWNGLELLVCAPRSAIGSLMGVLLCPLLSRFGASLVGEHVCSGATDTVVVTATPSCASFGSAVTSSQADIMVDIPLDPFQAPPQVGWVTGSAKNDRLHHFSTAGAILLNMLYMEHFFLSRKPDGYSRSFELLLPVMTSPEH
jgi:hypothetical protein